MGASLKEAVAHSPADGLGGVAVYAFPVGKLGQGGEAGDGAAAPQGIVLKQYHRKLLPGEGMVRPGGVVNSGIFRAVLDGQAVQVLLHHEACRR